MIQEKIEILETEIKKIVADHKLVDEELARINERKNNLIQKFIELNGGLKVLREIIENEKVKQNN